MKRIITALIIGALWLLILFSDSYILFWFFLSLVSCLALYEYYSMVSTSKRLIFLGMAAASIPIFATYFKSPELVSATLAYSLLLSSTLAIVFHHKSADPFITLGRFSFGIIFIGYCGAHLILLMDKHGGPFWLILLTAITIFSDSGAYYVGSYLGKTKLCPAISPGKTVEGFIGGLAGGAVAACIVTFLFFEQLAYWQTILLSFSFTCISVIGDLTESTIKRSMHRKDSGTLLPGHGGILDRIDSLLLCAPIFYYIIHYKILIGP